MQENAVNNKMGTKPVGRLLLTMSLPAMFSMLVMALYNIVDSLFVARVSIDALEALSIAFPMQMISVAVALGIGVGTGTIVARRLGEGNKNSANKYAQTGLMLALFFGVIFIVLGATVPRAFTAAFASNENVVNMGFQYLTVCMICTVFITTETTISKTMQGTGNMIIPMISQLIGAIINLALDPIMIFTLKLGVSGAAAATVIGQGVSMIFMLVMAHKRRHIIRIYFAKDFKFSWKRIGVIARVGAPAMVVNAVGGFVTMIMNGILAGYDASAVTVLGIYFKIQSFIFMPVFGLCQGALPIMSFNFGANNKKRFIHTFFLSAAISLVIMTAGTILFQVAPEIMLKMFAVDEHTMAIGITALRTISLIFIPASIGIIVSNAYQSIGYGISSLIMTLLRQLALIIPLAILFGKLWGLDAIWYSYFVAEIVPCVIFSLLFIHFVKRAFAKRQNMSMPTQNGGEFSSDMPAELGVESEIYADMANAETVSTAEIFEERMTEISEGKAGYLSDDDKNSNDELNDNK